MDSILFIDKPSGITSFDVIRSLRQMFRHAQPDKKPPKIGHAGTLDPLATGLLIIGLGKATKQLSQYMNLPKEYEVLIEFGKVSDTYDADGKVRIMQHAVRGLQEIDYEKLDSVLKKFTGEIQQTPPQFSAKRVNGKRAYDLARNGIEVDLKPVAVTIYSIDIMNFAWPLVRLRVQCSKGTYIRSLAHDLGYEFGCGGYIKELRRTAIGNFKVEKAQLLNSIILNH